MAQEQVQKQKAQSRTEETHPDVSNTDVTNAELAESTDAVLDSIDDVLDDQHLADLDDILEADAEEFVASYIQAGGE